MLCLACSLLFAVTLKKKKDIRCIIDNEYFINGSLFRYQATIKFNSYVLQTMWQQRLWLLKTHSVVCCINTTRQMVCIIEPQSFISHIHSIVCLWERAQKQNMERGGASKIKIRRNLQTKFRGWTFLFSWQTGDTYYS